MHRKGFTIIELVIVIAAIALLAAIAIPNLIASRKAVNESSAISTLRVLVSAEEIFRSRQNPPRYGTMKELVSLKLLDEEHGQAIDSKHAHKGYYVVQNGVGKNTYSFTAKAASQDITGNASYYVDQTGVIRFAPDGNVLASSAPLP